MTHGARWAICIEEACDLSRSFDRCRR
jgi:hypothetical protein